MPIEAGTCGDAHIGNKSRRSVVLRILSDGKVFAIGGSKQWHEERRPMPVKVSPKEPAGVALQLEVVTYYYANNTASIVPGKFRSFGKPCPPGVFHALLRLVGLRS